MAAASTVAIRLSIAALAALAAAWGASTLLSLPQKGLYATAQAVRRGEAFPSDDLRGLADRVSPATCRVEERESAVVIRIRLVAAVSAGRPPGSDTDLRDLRDNARRLVECSPASGVGWLGLYIATVRTEGLGPYALRLLSASFRNGPHEAWLQIIRLPLLLPIVDALPETLGTAVMADYSDIVADGLDPVAVTLIARAAPLLRARLLDGYCPVALERRTLVARELGGLLPWRRVAHPCLPELDRPTFAH